MQPVLELELVSYDAGFKLMVINYIDKNNCTRVEANIQSVGNYIDKTNNCKRVEANVQSVGNTSRS